jgi:hypothetical protein
MLTTFVATLRYHLAEGRDDGFPWCCRWRYALTDALQPDREQSAQRGVRFTDNLTGYVPCNLFHRKAMTTAAFDRILAHFDEWPPP